jgi:EAL and modified HD-GYP domain-containing signal transduction protein
MFWRFLSPRSAKTPPHGAGPAAADAPTIPDAAKLGRAANDRSRDAAFIARQPIFDATEKVVGFELLVRRSGVIPAAPATSVTDGAGLAVDILNRFGAAQALGDKLGFLQLGEGMLDSDLVELLPRERFVLEYPSTFLCNEERVDRCAALMRDGFQLARICQLEESDLSDAGRGANMVIYDLSFQTIQEILRIDRSVRHQNLRRIVRHIKTRADFDACKTFSFDLYQGDFFAQAETMAMSRLDPSRARVIELFNLVIGKAEVGEIEDAFKHDVALCYSLLCYINSVGIGLQYKVASIRDAVMLLGYDFLWRWLSLLVFAGVDLTAAQRVLLNTAVIRGRLMELLGQGNLSSKDGNFLFVVGIFSMLDALLGLPIEQVNTKLNLPEEVTAALVAREGRYAPYLELALAFESNNLARAERLCANLGIDLSMASQMHLAAIEWAGILAK